MAAAAPGLTERTAWARNLAAPLRDFLNTQSAGAVALLGAAVAALVWANSPWWTSYEDLWTTHLAVRLGGHELGEELRYWVDSGLMTFFFLVIGLEAKRELDVGALRERRRATIPFAAALGGLALPVAIFLAFNAGTPNARGWGAAMSTDTAFMLGLLGLLARNGTRLRVAMLTASVFDDLVALGVIAVAYTEHLAVTPLVVAVALLASLFALRWAPAEWRLKAAAVVGAGVWVALHASGIDPVIAGLAVGLVTGAYPPERTQLEQVTALTRSFREQPTPELARSASRGLAFAISPNERLQYVLHPWTSYVIVPLFALANAGTHVDGDLLRAAVTSPITLGILVAYVVGKPLGITFGSWLSVRFLGVERQLSWPVLAAGGVAAGMGFTVSLLIAGLAFHGQALAEAKLGVIGSVVLSTLGAWGAFRLIRRLPQELRARQLAGTADDLLDLADEVDPARDHIRGGEDAAVTLLEYGDFECPYCGQAEVVIRELLGSFGADLRYVWRHLPLNDVHPRAEVAAEAADAAAAQGRYWDMHDRLLADQELLDLGRHAEEIGLDMERFWDDLSHHRQLPRIAEDVASADASGVAGTPTFFVNGRRHYGAYDVDTLTAAVKAAQRREQIRLTAAA
jgi:Na+/H+ antiporter NhaA